MDGKELHVTLRTSGWSLPSLRTLVALTPKTEKSLREKADGTGVFFESEVSAFNESKELETFWWVAFAIRMGLPQSFALHGKGVAMRAWLTQLDESTNGLFYKTCREVNAGKAQDGVASLPMNSSDVVWRCFVTQPSLENTSAFEGWTEQSAKACGTVVKSAQASAVLESPRWSGMDWAHALLKTDNSVLSMKDALGSNWAQWLAAHTDGFSDNPECWVGLLNAMELNRFGVDAPNNLENSLMHSIAYNGQTQKEIDSVFEWGVGRGIRWDIPNKKGFTALEMAFHNPARREALEFGGSVHWPEDFTAWRARWEASALRRRVTGSQSKGARVETMAL